MNSRAVVKCATCHELKLSDGEWFQVVENRWTDRLRIFYFQETLALQPGTFNACCTAHLRELIVHWMTMGRLDFPFARVPLKHRHFLSLPSKSSRRPAVEPALPRSAFVGELAVHRASLARILREDPLALSGVLDALVRTIEPQKAKPDSIAPKLPSCLRGEALRV